MVWLICIPIVILYFAAGGILMRFFIENPSPTAMVSGVEFLKIVPPFYFVISVKLAADGILRGAGLMKPFMIATFSDLILRVVLASVLSIQFGYIELEEKQYLISFPHQPENYDVIIQKLKT